MATRGLLIILKCRQLGVKSLYSFDRLSNSLEADLNGDVVKHFEIHEKNYQKSGLDMRLSLLV